jgi:hypothetical protein
MYHARGNKIATLEIEIIESVLAENARVIDP